MCVTRHVPPQRHIPEKTATIWSPAEHLPFYFPRACSMAKETQQEWAWGLFSRGTVQDIETTFLFLLLICLVLSCVSASCHPGLPFKNTPIPEIKKHRKETYSWKVAGAGLSPVPGILLHVKLHISIKDETFSRWKAALVSDPPDVFSSWGVLGPFGLWSYWVTPWQEQELYKRSP